MTKEKEIQVVVVEPNKSPYVKWIPNTLKAQQEIVGGLIEPINIDREGDRIVDIMINEEALFLDLPLNRVLGIVDEGKVNEFPFYGTFYIVACDLSTGETEGLTDEETIEYKAMFSGFMNYMFA